MSSEEVVVSIYKKNLIIIFIYLYIETTIKLNKIREETVEAFKNAKRCD